MQKQIEGGYFSLIQEECPIVLDEWLNNVITNDSNEAFPSSSQIAGEAQDITFALKGSASYIFLFFMTS